MVSGAVECGDVGALRAREAVRRDNIIAGLLTAVYADNGTEVDVRVRESRSTSPKELLKGVSNTDIILKSYVCGFVGYRSYKHCCTNRLC